MRRALCCFALAVAAVPAAAQGGSQSTAAPLSTSRAVELAERGHCADALSTLKSNLRRVRDQQLRYRAAMAAARCAMSLGDPLTVVESLALLRVDFPQDPEVLYLSARFFSQLANRAAQELVQQFPASVQVAKMNAEALEAQRKWQDAVAAYRKILEQDPQHPDVHFRIARILLDTSSDAAATAEAKRELEQELKINPNNAAAEFVLGEVERRAGQWDTAIQHFSLAKELDVGFMEAYLALGMSLSAAGRHSEAIPPLEHYAKHVPADPAGHYQLAMAYSRTGNKAAADRQLQLHREALANSSARRPPTAPPQ